MKDKLKYEIWNLPEYIMKLEAKSGNVLTDERLEKISGGAMVRNVSAGLLAGISVLTAVPSFAKENVPAAATSVSVSSPSEVKNQDTNFEITKEQAIEDIDYVLKVIKDNHVSSVEKIPDEVTNQAKTEIENLGDKISVIDEWRMISRILARLHDAHTTVLAPKFLNKRLPFDTEYENGKFICKSGDFKGREIIAINDIEIEKLYKTFQNHCSHEVDEWTQYRFFEGPSDFIPELKLALCGIDTSKPVKVSFNTAGGVQSKNFEMSKIETPNENPEHWISYDIDEKNSVGIFKLNLCQCNDEYFSTLLNFYKEVSDKEIKNIVIDLRKNRGGNSTAAYMFAMFLKNLSKCKGVALDTRGGDTLLRSGGQTFNKDDIEQFRISQLGKNYDRNLLFGGSVFLLTSRGSFSSAMLFAELFQDNHLATVVGEIPGNSPESFGDISGKGFRTPNSKLGFTTTFKKFYRIDETKDGAKLIPDIEVPAKDALNKVYEIISSER